jgi:hypothetical protein
MSAFADYRAAIAADIAIVKTLAETPQQGSAGFLVSKLACKLPGTAHLNRIALLISSACPRYSMILVLWKPETPRRLGRLYWANAPPSVTPLLRLHRLRALSGLPKRAVAWVHRTEEFLSGSDESSFRIVARETEGAFVHRGL